MSDLGDISDFLKDAAVSDLSWLDVKEEEYRKSAPLPMQNLDVAPDLQGLWAHDDKPATAYKEKDHLPQTMGDLSSAHGPLRDVAREIVRTARLATMQSADPARITDALYSRFDLDTLRINRTALAGVLAERGLLGRYYIAAVDFPGCHNSPKKAVDFVRRFAGDARYVLAKVECSSCIRASKDALGRTHCSVFHKELTFDVPYTEGMAADVERQQAAKGKAVQASASEPKERIRLALLAEDAHFAPSLTYKPVEDPVHLLKPTVAPEAFVPKVDVTLDRQAAHEAVSQALASGMMQVGDAKAAYKAIAASTDRHELQVIRATAKGLPPPPRQVYGGAGEQAPLVPATQEAKDAQIIAASALTRKRDEEAARLLSARKAEPVLALLRREMLKGRSESELVHALKLAFQVNDLAATRAHWEPLFKEAGIFGTLYSTQDSFQDCREGADFLAKHNPRIRVMVAGSKCSDCFYNKMSRCLLYGKPLVREASSLLTWETAQSLFDEHKAAGRIPAWEKSAGLGSDPRTAIKNIHRQAALKSAPVLAGPRMDAAVHAFYGNTPTQTTSSLTRREIVKTASRYLNEGLYGDDLRVALQAKFGPRDLVASQNELRVVLAEQGLQGIYFVDPTIYDDYGGGCEEAARLFRAKGVPYVKVGPKCASCTAHIQQGHCSKIGKPLVIEPPYVDKVAQQRAVMASGLSTETSYSSLTNNGLSMIAEYELQNSGMTVDVAPPVEVPKVQVQFNANQKITF